MRFGPETTGACHLTRVSPSALLPIRVEELRRRVSTRSPNVLPRSSAAIPIAGVGADLPSSATLQSEQRLIAV